MKTTLSILCVILMLSVTQASPLPQTKHTIVSSSRFMDEFTRFNGHRQQRGVALTWQFSNPSNVVTYTIQRSYDGEFFETLANLPAAGGRNQYKDENGIYPGYLQYRIIAVMRDGSEVYSPIEMVRIVRNG